MIFFYKFNEFSDIIELIHKLNEIGINQDIDLPRIVVVGKQSSGKSSVMESLTGISFPRNEGTCTRNVFDVKSKLNKDIDYNCSIKLRFICDDKTNTELKKPIIKD